MAGQMATAWLFTIAAAGVIAAVACFAAPIVDTSALFKIVVASLAGGAGCATAFGVLLLGLSRGSKTTNGGVRVFNYGTVLIAGLFRLAAVVLGIPAMVSKT